MMHDRNSIFFAMISEFGRTSENDFRDDGQGFRHGRSEIVNCGACFGTGIGANIFQAHCKVCGGSGKLRV